MLVVLLQNNKNLCHNVIFCYPMVLIIKGSVKLFKTSARGELLLPHVSLSNQGEINASERPLLPTPFPHKHTAF